MEQSSSSLSAVGEDPPGVAAAPGEDPPGVAAAPAVGEQVVAASPAVVEGVAAGASAVGETSASVAPASLSPPYIGTPPPLDPDKSHAFVPAHLRYVQTGVLPWVHAGGLHNLGPLLLHLRQIRVSSIRLLRALETKLRQIADGVPSIL